MNAGRSEIMTVVAKKDQYCMAKVVAKVGLNLRPGEPYSDVLKTALLLLLMGCL
jgi:hypothetical protein